MYHDSHLYDAEDTVVYQTDEYGGSHTDIDATERFTDDIDLTVDTEANVHFTFDGSDATDDLVLTLYKRNDSSWSDNEAGWKAAITVTNAGTETEYHYTIPAAYGAGHYRFGIKSSGATTSFELEVAVRQSRITRSKA